MNHHPSVGSIDRPVLIAIEQRLRTAAHVRETVIAPKRGKATLTAFFDTNYFPPAVEKAYYDIRWYTSGDFEIHYQENWIDDTWQRRWDRHQRNGSRTHYHPPPDVGHPPTSISLSTNYHEVLQTVEEETIAHIKTHSLYDQSSMGGGASERPNW